MLRAPPAASCRRFGLHRSVGLSAQVRAPPLPLPALLCALITDCHLVSPGPPGCQGVLASSGPMWHQVAPSGHQFHRSSVHGRMRLHLPAATTGGDWWPLEATWFPQVPQGARGVWPQVAPCGTKWPPVATSFIGPRSTVVCVCTFQLPPLVATGGHWWPLGFPRSPRVPGGSGLKWPHVAPSGPQWPPVSSVLGPRSYAFAPSSCHHWW